MQPLVGQVDHAFESGPENEQLKLNSNLRSLITLLLQMRTTKQKYPDVHDSLFLTNDHSKDLNTNRGRFVTLS